MKTKTMRILSALLVILMTVNALGTLSLTVSAATRNTGTWGEITTEGVLSYADFSFRNGHEGTEEDPYEISTAAQLAGLAALVNACNGSTVELTDAQGNTATATDFFKNGAKQHVKLTADIDLSEHRWMPIGIGEADAAPVFAGSFDGAGHTVSGMTIGTDDEPMAEYPNVGLFGCVRAGGVKNLTVSGSVNVSHTSGKSYVGGVVGYAYCASVINCHSRVNVTVSQRIAGAPCYVGGVVGAGSPTLGVSSLDTHIIGCINSGTVTVTCICSDTYACCVGGVAGHIENTNATFVNCFNSGSVTGGKYTGGVVGYAKHDHEIYRNMVIYNCANVGDVTGDGHAGGIVGGVVSLGPIENCYHAGSVSGAYAGGIVGDADSNSGATFCYWLSGSAEAASADGEGHFDNCSALSEAQMTAASGSTDASWEEIFYTNEPLALVDALNEYARRSNVDNATCTQWHICSAAGASVYPTYDRCSYTDNGDGNTHKKQYECCEAVVDEDAHFESDMVTCLGTVCEGCGAYYGATDSAHHVSTERVYRPDETGPYDYHNQHHACCGALIEDTQERHNDFTYTMEQINDSEQYVFTKTCLTCNGVVGKQYITVADRPYDGTPHAYAMDESEGDFGLLEGTYCCDGGCIDEGEHTLTFVLSDQHQFEIPFTITEGHIFEGGVCTDCGCLNATLVGSNLTLDGNIGLNFYFELDQAIVGSGTALVRFTLASGSVIEIPVSEGRVDTTTVGGKTLYVFTCELNAKQMADTVIAQVVMGENASAQYPHSIVDYANTIIANAEQRYTDEEIALVKAMLNYGANAQLNFGYNTENLANAGLSEAEKSLSDVTAETFEPHKVTENTVEGIGTFVGSDLVLESETTLNVYFQPADGVTIEELTFTVGGKTVTPVKSGEYYVIPITNIRSDELDDVFTVSVAKGTEGEGSFDCSVLAYCYSVLSDTADTYSDELKDTLKALYLYNAAANTYFNSEE